jgi:hypothetical protein
MAGWEVVSQEPAAPQFEDRWAVVEETAQQDPWKPVSQTPIQAAVAPQTAPAASSEPTFLQKVHEKIDPEPIIGGVGASVGRMLTSLLGLPQRAIEGSQQDVATMGSGAPKETVEPATEAALATMPLRKTVGGVRAHPTDSAKPVEQSVTAPSQKVDPLAPPESQASLVVAREMPDGTIRYGKPGQIHADLVDANHFETHAAPPPTDTMGFAKPGGKFMTREEALAYVKANEPEGAYLAHEPTGLQAEKYNKGMGVEKPAPEMTAAQAEANRTLENIARKALGDDPLAHPEPSPQQLTGARKAARVIQNILNPDEVSPLAQSAAADIRQAGGKAARDTETTRAALDAESQKVSRLPDEEKLRLIDYIETRSKEGTAPLREDLMPVADAVKKSMDLRRSKIEALDSAEKAQFVQDYYTHLWKDPEAAAQVFTGPAKEGTGRFLKERSVPTVAEGIARGLEPVSLNPLEVTMRYVQSMDRFIATKQVLDKGLKEGTLKHYTPGEQPPGWVEVNTRKAGGPVYAPADWARVYNNFVDRGIHGWNEDLGMVYDAARKATNSVTALELGISGFHFSTMAQEAVVNGVSKAINELASGKPISAVKSVVLSPFTPVTNTIRGRTLEHVYLGKKQGTPLMREITDLLTEAGGRAKGMKHAPEYEYSAGGSYWDSFKHGTALMEAKALGKEFTQAPLKTAAIYPFRQVGRILQTFAKPLFEYAIPKLKNGAFYDNMASWMEANPGATKAQQLKEARKIWNSIDNRFGETVQDNIFWNKTLKQALQISLRSYSWTFGTIQEIGGGVAALARHPSSLSMKSQHYNPKSAYVIALPIVYATLNAVLQKLKTGKDPESIEDLMRGGLTGGTAPGVGGRGEVPERVMMPGYMKDVFGWYHHPVQEAKNKMATLPRMVGETITNKDWRDKPIRDENAPTPDQVRQYFEYVYRSLGPISLKQIAQGQKRGSNIGVGESLLGLRPAPAFLQDPEGYEKMKKGIGQRDWKSKVRADKKQERQYGGPQ